MAMKALFAGTASSIIGSAENGGHENDGPSKLQGMKLQDMNLQDKFAGR